METWPAGAQTAEPWTPPASGWLAPTSRRPPHHRLSPSGSDPQPPGHPGRRRAQIQSLPARSASTGTAWPPPSEAAGVESSPASPTPGRGRRCWPAPAPLGPAGPERRRPAAGCSRRGQGLPRALRSRCPSTHPRPLAQQHLRVLCCWNFGFTWAWELQRSGRRAWQPAGVGGAAATGRRARALRESEGSVGALTCYAYRNQRICA